MRPPTLQAANVTKDGAAAGCSNPDGTQVHASLLLTSDFTLPTRVSEKSECHSTQTSHSESSYGNLEAMATSHTKSLVGKLETLGGSSWVGDKAAASTENAHGCAGGATADVRESLARLDINSRDSAGGPNTDSRHSSWPESVVAATPSTTVFSKPLGPLLETVDHLLRDVEGNLSADAPNVESVLKAKESNVVPIHVAAGVLAASIGGALPGITSESSAALSLGSMGHPGSCGAPCKYYQVARGCKNGDQCAHCHSCRWRKIRKAPAKEALQPCAVPISLLNTVAKALAPRGSAAAEDSGARGWHAYASGVYSGISVACPVSAAGTGASSLEFNNIGMHGRPPDADQSLKDPFYITPFGLGQGLTHRNKTRVVPIGLADLVVEGLAPMSSQGLGEVQHVNTFLHFPDTASSVFSSASRTHNRRSCVSEPALPRPCVAQGSTDLS